MGPVTGPVYQTGDRVTWRGHPGTVASVRLIESESVRNPLPVYQRVRVELDPNREHIHEVEGASRHFPPETRR